MSTLYERLGGEDAVDTAVDIFYEKVLADDRISMYFENLDMVAQAMKQKKFLTMVFGGLIFAPMWSAALGISLPIAIAFGLAWGFIAMQRGRWL